MKIRTISFDDDQDPSAVTFRVTVDEAKALVEHSADLGPDDGPHGAALAVLRDQLAAEPVNGEHVVTADVQTAAQLAEFAGRVVGEQEQEAFDPLYQMLDSFVNRFWENGVDEVLNPGAYA
jgi:hypothetical protein